ncbi:MAG: rhamnogalacturonan acetylesterase [Firmicutes bacterium]|nr:rhamnogalacturonan acetylesterase [Bacillota bacterium]
MVKHKGVAGLKFVFGKQRNSAASTLVIGDILYSEAVGYGFMSEKNTGHNQIFQIPELNSGFSLSPDLQGQLSTRIRTEATYCYLEDSNIPLVFKAKVPASGNYRVTLRLIGLADDARVTIFSERRRCMLLDKRLPAEQVFQYQFIANLCEFIPRGKKEVYQDLMLDVAIVGKNVGLQAIQVDVASALSTIYMAGDSTMTDQGAYYPYYPWHSYCGWGQMFSALLKPEIAVSNHAHSGLTTESYKPHWEIVKKHFKPGDWFFIQFGHNDQKQQHLEPFGGYQANLRDYVEQVLALDGKPIIISPVSRSLWHPDGTFNDLLSEYADACRQLAEEMNVPFVDLHARSVAFIKKLGPKDSLRFFYPNDYTHFNDYGGFAIAKLVYQELIALELELTKHLKTLSREELATKLPKMANEEVS